MRIGNGLAESLRGRGRAKKGIFLEGLKGKPPQRGSEAGDGILGAIIDGHCYDKHHGVDDYEERYEPREPFLEVLDFSVDDGSGGRRRRRLDGDGVDHVGAPP